MPIALGDAAMSYWVDKPFCSLCSVNLSPVTSKGVYHLGSDKKDSRRNKNSPSPISRLFSACGDGPNFFCLSSFFLDSASIWNVVIDAVSMSLSLWEKKSFEITKNKNVSL